LSDQPEFQKKIYEEVEARIFTQPRIDFDSLFLSEYFNLVTKESLRRFNPFPASSPRKLTKDITLAGKKLKKGMNLAFPVLAMHLMKRYHEEPLKFDISRHTPEKKEKQIKLTNMPFFAGRRVCIGQYMGDMMVKVIISLFVRNFEWKKDFGYQPYMKQGLT
jgi:cytochrome P450